MPEREHSDDLATRINEGYLRFGDPEVGRAEYRALMLEVGELLSEARSKYLEEWPAWLEENCDVPAKVARDLLELHDVSRELRNIEGFIDDDRNLTDQGIAAREDLRRDIEEIDRDADAVWQEHWLD
jgi:hypothetical protein